jgi:hypothetical protein
MIPMYIAGLVAHLVFGPGGVAILIALVALCHHGGDG